MVNRTMRNGLIANPKSEQLLRYLQTVNMTPEAFTHIWGHRWPIAHGGVSTVLDTREIRISLFLAAYIIVLTSKKGTRILHKHLSNARPLAVLKAPYEIQKTVSLAIVLLNRLLSPQQSPTTC